MAQSKDKKNEFSAVSTWIETNNSPLPHYKSSILQDLNWELI